MENETNLTLGLQEPGTLGLERLLGPGQLIGGKVGSELSTSLCIGATSADQPALDMVPDVHGQGHWQVPKLRGSQAGRALIE